MSQLSTRAVGSGVPDISWRKQDWAYEQVRNWIITGELTPGARIDYTLAGYAWAEQHWPWMQAVCTWAFRYPAPQHSYGDYFTFVSPEFVAKPIYDAVREWASP